MKKAPLKFILLAVLLSVAFVGINGSAQQAETAPVATGQQKKAYEPAGKFTPTEKLRADDAVAFPVDI